MIAFRRTLFLSLFLTLLYSQAFSQQGGQLDTATGIFDRISQNNAYVESLRYAALNVLPAGFRQEYRGLDITIAIDQLVSYADHLTVSVFARAILPQGSGVGERTTLMFGARDIRLSHDGSILGDARLVLLSDITIPISRNMSLVLLGHYDIQTGQAHSATYMTNRSANVLTRADFENITTATDMDAFCFAPDLGMGPGDQGDAFALDNLPVFSFFVTEDGRRGIVMIREAVYAGAESYVVADIKIEKVNYEL